MKCNFKNYIFSIKLVTLRYWIKILQFNTWLGSYAKYLLNQIVLLFLWHLSSFCLIFLYHNMLYCLFLPTIVTSACIVFGYFEKCTVQSSLSKSESWNDCLICLVPSCTPHFCHLTLNSVKPSSFPLFLPLLFPPSLQSVLNNALYFCLAYSNLQINVIMFRSPLCNLIYFISFNVNVYWYP